MDFLEALMFDVLQTIGLVPTSGEHVKRYLTPDGVGEAVGRELRPKDFDEGVAMTIDL